MPQHPDQRDQSVIVTTALDLEEDSSLSAHRVPARRPEALGPKATAR